jgi:hypothetical protein
MSSPVFGPFSVPHKDCICWQGNKFFEHGDICSYIYTSRGSTDDGLSWKYAWDKRTEQVYRILPERGCLLMHTPYIPGNMLS